MSCSVIRLPQVSQKKNFMMQSSVKGIILPVQGLSRRFKAGSDPGKPLAWGRALKRIQVGQKLLEHETGEFLHTLFLLWNKIERRLGRQEGRAALQGDVIL